MGMPIVDKILARHAGRDRVRPGDIVVCDVDMAVRLDIEFAAGMDVDAKRIADPERVAIILDHAVPAPTIADAAGQSAARAFARKFGVRRFYDVGQHGICHQVILENALALPGQILACTDSHTIASGALNCAARGLGPIEMLQIVCTGKTWFRVSPTIRVDLEGEKPGAVFGKDVLLHLASFGSAEGMNVEFAGAGLRSLTLDDRSTVATMCAEVSANFATFPADETVVDHVRRVTDAAFELVWPDPDAEYADVRNIDLAALRPYVALPDFVPENTLPAADVGDVRIDQAFVGSCANGKLEDLR